MKITQILKPKVIAEILGVSLSAVYSKLKEENGNRFSENDLQKIKEFTKKITAQERIIHL